MPPSLHRGGGWWKPFAVLTCLVSLSLGASCAPPTVEDGSISYVGATVDGTESFLNIRYGQDTSGQRRFKHPLPYRYAPGTKVVATAPGAACPQALGNPVPAFEGIYGLVTNISEDCLTVRVSRPVGTKPGDRVPVLVYLFGGGYAFGSIFDDTAYDPRGLVRENAAKGLPVIYVGINYRSGFLGFAASKPLRDEDSLNAGLLDQYLGLQWVRDHIEAFGGDKDDVTIFGEDVGWTNVQLQITAYGGRAEHLFKRAILQSGPTPSGASLTAGLSDTHTTQLTQILNCTSNTGDGASELACLRNIPLADINDAAVAFGLTLEPLGGLGAFRPTAPSPFVPDAPSKLLATGRYRKDVAVIAGWNENDGTVFVPADINSTAYFSAMMAFHFPGLTAANQARLAALYPEGAFADYPREGVERNFFRAAQAVRDAFFACPSLRAAGAAAAADGSYVYALNASVFTLGHEQYNRSFVGVDHFSDVPYAFAYVARAPYSAVASQADYDLAARVAGSWAAFATHGRPAAAAPGGAGNMTFDGWEPAGQGATRLRVLGGPGDGMVTTESYGENEIPIRCGFWDQEDVLAQTYM